MLEDVLPMGRVRLWAKIPSKVAGRHEKSGLVY